MRLIRLALPLCVVALLLGVSGVAAAQDSESSESSSDSSPNHHSGLMLRVTAGAGYANTGFRERIVGSDVSFGAYGPTLELDAALGGVLFRNFAIHGTVQYWAAPNPNLRVRSGSYTIDGSTSDDTMLSGLLVGGGVTAWLGESNVYGSASLGAVMLRAENDRFREDSDWGFGGQALLGKEWWLGSSLGIGLAAAFSWHVTPETSTSPSLRGYTAGGRLSFTLN